MGSTSDNKVHQLLRKSSLNRKWITGMEKVLANHELVSNSGDARQALEAKASVLWSIRNSRTPAFLSGEAAVDFCEDIDFIAGAVQVDPAHLFHIMRGCSLFV